ncbi:MAG: phosphate acetyltransferase [Bacteroidetes bacterium]|jgi:phosphate acetyltransferase|nr:phosphate acetyltransferase [Bacteroidota bacterium]
MDLINKIRAGAKGSNIRIVLPEGAEERTLKAADIILEEDLAALILLGNVEEIKENARHWNLKHISKASIFDPLSNDRKQYFADLLFELRKHKGLLMEQALKLVEDPLYLSVLLIKAGEADGEVAGANNATGDVLRPAFQVIKTLPGISAVSGAFIMVVSDKQYGDEGVMIFADCAVNPDPTVKELAEIALASAQTARSIAGIEPRVAMLSFSTKGSAKHEKAQKMIDATILAKALDPDLQIDGELQADAAIVEAIGRKKAPDSTIAGKANVLVFPSLETGNIAYKLVQRLAGAEAIGPVLQGLAAPINDLSRGCSVEDIVNLVAITVNQAKDSVYKQKRHN